jgi:preprotein translocase subunit SecB
MVLRPAAPGLEEATGATMAEQEKATEKQLAISKIYIKDLSFESPQTPTIFKAGEWNPETNLNLRSTHRTIEDDSHEVVLTITIEAKESDKTIFLIELQQAGIFEIAGYEKDELATIVGTFCPNILFPYARESIATTVQKGGFPEFVMQPINFDALYLQAKQQQAEGAAPDAH